MDITNAIMDQELGHSVFTVERLTYTRTAEGTTSRSVTYQAIGCLHPGTPEMIQLLPEEKRYEEFIANYTDFALSLGSDWHQFWDGRVLLQERYTRSDIFPKREPDPRQGGKRRGSGLRGGYEGNGYRLCLISRSRRSHPSHHHRDDGQDVRCGLHHNR